MGGSAECANVRKIPKILQFVFFWVLSGFITLRPYGFTSVWSANGYIKVKMECDRCYPNIKGYFNGVYVDSLKYKINCQKKIP